MSEQSTEDEGWMEWRGLQGARGSVYALMSGVDSGKLAFLHMLAQAWNVTAVDKQQEAVVQHQQHSCKHRLHLHNIYEPSTHRFKK